MSTELDDAFGRDETLAHNGAALIDMQPEQAQEPTSRLDALEHQINADHDPETGAVLDEGRSEEDTGEGTDLANAIAAIDAAEIVVGVNSRLAEYEYNFTGDRKSVVEGKRGSVEVTLG